MALTSFLLAAAVSLAPDPAVQAPDPPQPRQALPVREGTTLLDVARGYAAALGVPWKVEPAAAEALARTEVGLLGEIDVPAAGVHAFAQALLALGGFGVVGLEDGLEIVALEASAGRALAVGEEDLGRLGDHGALLVRATLSYPRARVAATALLGFARAERGESVAAQGADTLVLEGTLASVLRLRDAVRGAAGEAPLAPAADPAELLAAPEDPGARFEARPEDRLVDLLARYAAATGRAVWVGPDFASGERPCGLLAPVACDAARAHALVEGVLRAHQVHFTVHGVGHASPPRAILAVELAPDLTRPALRLDPARLAFVRDHPATSFAGELTLEGADVRHLATSLRPLLGGAGTSLLATGDDRIHVAGDGLAVAQVAEIFAALEGRAPAAFPAPAPAPDAAVAAGEPGRPASVRELLAAWARAAGAGVVAPAETAPALAAVAPGAEGSMRGADAGALLADRLARADLSLSLVSVDPPLYAVALGSGSGAAASDAFRRGRVVAPADLAALPGALVVSVVVPLERLEPRLAAVEVRKAAADEPDVIALPLADESLVLVGPAARLGARVERLRALDAAAPPAGDDR